jgi:hypothetical protein
LEVAVAEQDLREQIIERIELERIRWEDLLSQIPPEQMIEPKTFGGWSFKDVVAHITGWDRPCLDDFAAAAHRVNRPSTEWPVPFEETEQDDTKVQIVNDWLYERNRDRSLEDVLAEFRRNFEELHTIALAMPERLLDDPSLTSKLCRKSFAEDITSGAFFDHFHQEHEPAIRAWLDELPV